MYGLTGTPGPALDLWLLLPKYTSPPCRIRDVNDYGCDLLYGVITLSKQVNYSICVRLSTRTQRGFRYQLLYVCTYGRTHARTAVCTQAGFLLLLSCTAMQAQPDSHISWARCFVDPFRKAIYLMRIVSD